jgi:triphosphoribosyl-dephospho-CoA synthase
VSPFQSIEPFSVGQCATLACLLEVAAPKPGNVHRGADFEDLTFQDFLASAVAIAPSMDAAAAGSPLGRVVLQAIAATRRVAPTNTNLGTVLLLAPLAMASAGSLLPTTVAQVLRGLAPEDARDVYAAIRLAQPGGMGRVREHDIEDGPPVDLLAAMRLAADRDRVARQYACGFADIFEQVVPLLREPAAVNRPLPERIVYLQLQLLATMPDSLIARKCGDAVARQASDRAAAVLEQGSPGEEAYEMALADFDFWLRSDGHRRNPGTTADLIAAGLFVGLRQGWLLVEHA